jgi:hypothetical protein
MNRLFLTAFLLMAVLLMGTPAFGSTIIVVTCSIPYPGGGYQTQTDLFDASCNLQSGFPLGGQGAVAEGSVADGSFSGIVFACCLSSVEATLSSSFTESFNVPTVLSWSFSGSVIGGFAYVALSGGGMGLGYCDEFNQSGCDNSGETMLSPGGYTFDFTTHVSELLNPA